MKIISFEIQGDNISLVTDTNFSRLVLSYNRYLKNNYEKNNLSTNKISIPKTLLNLTSLYNNYFRIEIYDEINNKISGALYEIDIINNLESKLYNARDLKTELDNLNFYYNILESLTNKEAFMEANEFFYNFLDFLNNKLNANNIFQVINRQD